MTDAHLRTAGNHVIAALAEPFFENRRINADLAGSTGPAGQHFDLDVTVVDAEPPIGPTFENRKAGAAKPLRCGPCRVGAERWSKPLIGALVAIDGGNHGRIVTALRRQGDHAVVAQRRV